MRLVADASVILAFIRQEPGGDVARPLLVGAPVSTVNLSEAAARLLDKRLPEAEAPKELGALLSDVRPFDRALAFRAAQLRPQARHLGLSFADRACLALARELRLPALTGDRAWAGLTIGAEVRLFR